MSVPSLRLDQRASEAYPAVNSNFVNENTFSHVFEYSGKTAAFYRLVRRRVINNFRNKLRELENIIRVETRPDASHLRKTRFFSGDVSGNVSTENTNKISMLSFKTLPKLCSVLTSYLAYSSKANSYKIVIKTLHPHQWLKQFFRFFRTKAAILDDFLNKRKELVLDHLSKVEMSVFPVILSFSVESQRCFAYAQHDGIDLSHSFKMSLNLSVAETANGAILRFVSEKK